MFKDYGNYLKTNAEDGILYKMNDIISAYKIGYGMSQLSFF